MVMLDKVIAIGAAVMMLAAPVGDKDSGVPFGASGMPGYRSVLKAIAKVNTNKQQAVYRKSTAKTESVWEMYAGAGTSTRQIPARGKSTVVLGDLNLDGDKIVFTKTGEEVLSWGSLDYGNLFGFSPDGPGAYAFVDYWTTGDVDAGNGYKPFYIHHTTGYTGRKISQDSKGDYLEEITAPNGSLPNNGKHTDGYWYEFQRVVED